MENYSGNEEVYSIKQISRKLSDRFLEQTANVRIATAIGSPHILLREESAAKVIKDSLVVGEKRTEKGRDEESTDKSTEKNKDESVFIKIRPIINYEFELNN